MLYGRLNNAHSVIPECELSMCEYVTFNGKRDFAGVIQFKIVYN